MRHAVLDDEPEAFGAIAEKCTAAVSRVARAMHNVNIMSPHAVDTDVIEPLEYSRAQLALRLVLFALLGWIGVSFGAVFLALYIGLPAYAAAALTNGGEERFRARTTPRIENALRWVLGVYAYFALLTDRLPMQRSELDVVVDVEPSGRPTVSSALLRIVYGIPSALVLALLMCVSAIAWLVAFVFVLAHRRYPRALFNLQLVVVRWMARLFGYQASLVDEYPPFELSSDGHAPLRPSRQH